MHDIGLFRRPDPLAAGAAPGGGADILARYTPTLTAAGATIVSPHKVYGPESNDLILQLRKRGVETVILSGLAANLCTDSHLRALVENGFRVIAIEDAVGAPGEAAYQAAQVNFGLIAHGVWSTAEAVRWMGAAR